MSKAYEILRREYRKGNAPPRVIQELHHNPLLFEAVFQSVHQPSRIANEKEIRLGGEGGKSLDSAKFLNIQLHVFPHCLCN